MFQADPDPVDGDLRQLAWARSLDLAEDTYAIIIQQCRLYAQSQGLKTAEKKLRDTMAELKK